MRAPAHYTCGLRRYRGERLAWLDGRSSLWRLHDYGRRTLSSKPEPAESSIQENRFRLSKVNVGPSSAYRVLTPARHIPEHEKLAPNLLDHIRKYPGDKKRADMMRELEGLLHAVTTDVKTRRSGKADKDGIDILRGEGQTKRWRERARRLDRQVGLVPTMGALHEGHIRLIRQAAKENDEICVSIFVNPTQFGPTEDLASYPKTWDADLRKLRKLNEELLDSRERGTITAIFAPSVETMYPGVKSGNALPTNLSYVLVDPSLTSVLEGAARPTFFRGVTTVVMKLFWFIQPKHAYFGQKDAQQLVVIMRMVRDFCIPVIIRPVWIERDESGLALSSRNAYLGDRRKHVARVLKRALYASELVLRRGVTNRNDVLQAAVAVFNDELNAQKRLPIYKRATFELEYLSMADMHNLQEIADAEDAERCVISGVIVMLPLEAPNATERLGTDGDRKPVRLLDNLLWHRGEKKQPFASNTQDEKDSNPKDEKSSTLKDEERV